jgi:uncharacterized protein YgiM (DUF1202 family)
VSRSYSKTVQVRVPGARSIAGLAVATTLVTGLIVGRAALGGVDAPTAQAQEAPVEQAIQLAATPTAAPPQEEVADAVLPEGVISMVESPATALQAEAAPPVQENPPAPQASPGYAAGDAVVINADALNFRTEPGLNGDVAAILAPGLQATVVSGPTIADNFTWYQLDANGVTGWSAGEFLAPAGTILSFAFQASAAPLFPVGSPVVVADGELNVRAAAGLDGAIQDQLVTGTAATIVDGPTAADGYTWYQLDVNGITGWSAGEYLTQSPADALLEGTS